ncbi:MAG: hypothetical protein IJ555_08045 [Ruminococcus sp.]|nr:hypothetical protein [Ruminococcus sp.]MBR1739059.1 hypothetical protein [Ruminococcus sp.]
MEITISAADRSEEKLFYNCDDEEIKAAKIGHLRMDFGNGRQFFSTWWDNGTDMNDGSFKRDLGRLIDSLRKTLLSDRSLMADFIRKTDSLDLGDRGNGFKVQTDDNVFFLRCLPRAGEYDCYCYCYDRRLLEQAMSQTDSEDMAEETVSTKATAALPSLSSLRKLLGFTADISCRTSRSLWNILRHRSVR